MAVAKRALDVTQDLSHAVESGDVEAVALLLPHVVDLNARNRHGTTVLMRAASCGQAQIVRLLLDHGADPNVMRNDKFTALALAAFFGHTETVKTLMEFGARTEDVTRSGASAQTWATARTELRTYMATWSSDSCAMTKLSASSTTKAGTFTL